MIASLTAFNNVFGHFLYEGKQYYEALRPFQKALEIDPGNARAKQPAASQESIAELRNGMPLTAVLSFGNRSFRANRMAIKIVRSGSPREEGEGLRIGTVRRPPRGVKKEELAAKNFYDLWFPNLAPSEALFKEIRSASDENAWKVFKRKFLAEMKTTEAAKDLDLLAALSHRTNLAIGCYCPDENRCHRSLLREVLMSRGAEIE
ncbi:MAG: DUF488 domain-containing protein [Methylococcales bacterium]